MRLEPISLEEAWPYINRRAIFWDLGLITETRFLQHIAHARNMHLVCTRRNGKPVHIAWAFKDPYQLAHLPEALEVGMWSCSSSPEAAIEFWALTRELEYCKGFKEFYGLGLEKNYRMFKAVEAAGGKVYHNFCVVDGKICALQILQKEACYTLNDYKHMYGVL